MAAVVRLAVVAGTQAAFRAELANLVVQLGLVAAVVDWVRRWRRWREQLGAAAMSHRQSQTLPSLVPSWLSRRW